MSVTEIAAALERKTAAGKVKMLGGAWTKVNATGLLRGGAKQKRNEFLNAFDSNFRFDCENHRTKMATNAL